ncbi:MAG: glycosyltransferase family 4 protein [Luteolibacter sp.]
MQISIVTTMGVLPWAGSEELWFLAALAMAEHGTQVEVCYPVIRGWAPKMDTLRQAGIEIHGYGTHNHRLNGWTSAFNAKFRGSQGQLPFPSPGNWKQADLVVVSQGGISDGLGWIEYLAQNGLPFAIICQANTVASWPDDLLAARLRAAYSAAKRVFFVSEDNLRLFRTQTAYDVNNAEVIWNPLQSGTPALPLPWPGGQETVLKLAMVGRMEPFAKGQDLLIEALADPEIRKLPIEVNLHCHGPWEATCRRLIEQLDLDRVKLAPYATPEEIWTLNHALLLPSRHEGMSLAMLEAMWLGRPVIATAVAGAISEIIDGESGFLIPGASTALVIDALRSAWEQRHRLESMGTQAAERLRNRMPADPGSTLAGKLAALGGNPLQS